MDQDPYQPPGASLREAGAENGLADGNLESALRGDYEVTIEGVIKESWRLLKGNKGAVWLAVLVAGIILIAINQLAAALGLPDGQEAMLAGNFLAGYGQAMLGGIILIPLTVPIFAGIYMLSIKRVGGERVGVNELFAYFGKMVPLVIISLIATVFTYAGFLLLVLPGIYLTVAYAFAVPLMLDKDLAPWESLESSRKAVTHHWFSVFIVAIVIYLLGILLSLTLVGIIWAVPMMLLGYGVLYRQIFGYEGKDAASVVEA